VNDKDKNAEIFATLYNDLDPIDQSNLKVLILIKSIENLIKRNCRLILYAAMYAAFLLVLHASLHQVSLLGFLVVECGGALAATLIVSTLVTQN